MKRGAYLFINTGSLGTPQFNRSSYLNGTQYADGVSATEFPGLLFFNFRNADGNYPTVTMVDWNSDGVLDVNYAVAWTHILFGKRDAQGRWTPGGSWIRQTSEGTDRFGHTPQLRSVDFDGDGTNEILGTSAGDGELWLFTRNPNTASNEYYVKDRLIFAANTHGGMLGKPAGWWHPKPGIIDWDEDGDPDVLCGWGGGNNQGQQGQGIWLYRMAGGTAGTDPIYSSSAGMVQIPNQNNIQIRVFPNPCRGFARMHLTGIGKSEAVLRIFNAQGKLVRTINGTGKGSLAWKPESGASGTFLFELNNGKKRVKAKQIIIK
jgi:hypothetical protein